jgi:hypothetical protein
MDCAAIIGCRASRGIDGDDADHRKQAYPRWRKRSSWALQESQRVARYGQAVSCDGVAVNEGWATELAMASPIDDSGDGACNAELFEPAQKIEQLLRDGFMQGSSPGRRCRP